MKRFPIHTIESAPEKSKQALKDLQNRFGFIPNVAATMAESPVLMNAFIQAFLSFHGSTFTEAEKQVLLLTNAATIGSSWTVAFHSTVALQDGVSAPDVEAIRGGRLPSDRKSAALSGTAKALIEKRGRVSDEEVAAFTSAGYTQTQILEVINGIGISTMAAITGNLAATPIEERFRAQVWKAACSAGGISYS
jgi:alkylhydroperoxidase family enzyme